MKWNCVCDTVFGGCRAAQVPKRVGLYLRAPQLPKGVGLYAAIAYFVRVRQRSAAKGAGPGGVETSTDPLSAELYCKRMPRVHEVLQRMLTPVPPACVCVCVCVCVHPQVLKSFSFYTHKKKLTSHEATDEAHLQVLGLTTVPSKRGLMKRQKRPIKN